MLSRSELLSRGGAQVHVVRLETINEDVSLRQVAIGDLWQLYTDEQDDNRRAVKLLALSLCDSNGRPLFNDDEGHAALQQLAPAVFQELIAHCLDLNALGNESGRKKK